MTKWIRYAAVILSMMSFSAGAAAQATVDADACTSWIAFTVQPTSDTPGQVGLFLLDPDSNERRHILTSFDIAQLRWSPDGSRLLFDGRPLDGPPADYGLYVYDFASEAAVPLGETRTMWFEWSPSGAYAAFGAGPDIHVVSVSGEPIARFAETTASWLPDGRLFLSNKYGIEYRPAQIVDLPDGQVEPFDPREWIGPSPLLSSFPVIYDSVAASPDRALVLLRFNNIAAHWDILYAPAVVPAAAALLLEARPADVVPDWPEDIALLEGLAHRTVYVSEFGRFYIPLTESIYPEPTYFAAAREAIVAGVMEGVTPPLLARAAEIRSIARSPDGTQVLVRVLWDGHDLPLVADTASGHLLDLSASVDFPYYLGSAPRMLDVMWAPDRQRLAVLQQDEIVVFGGLEGALDITTGTGFPEADGPGRIVHVVAWSADGDRILFQTGIVDGGMPSALYTIQPDGTDLRRIYDGRSEAFTEIRAFAWSPCAQPQ